MSIDDFTQKPMAGATYAKNGVPKFVITTQSTILAQLYIGAENVFNGSYAPDFTGTITIDFEGLYDQYLTSTIPVTGADEIVQNLYRRQFTAYFWVIEGEDIPSDNNYISWYVANAKLKSASSFQSWIAQNFLTNQPMEKRTNSEAPEWLTWLDLTGAYKLKARFYLKAGSFVDVMVKDDNGVAGCYSKDVSYKSLIKKASVLPGSLKGYYDLIMFINTDDRIAVQRYIYEERTGIEKYFCFVNALGGIDTVVCHGENVLAPEITLNVGRFGNTYRQLDDAENYRQWKQSTGYVPENHKYWLFELITQAKGAVKFEATSSKYYEIVLNASDMSISDTKQMVGCEFGYIMAATDNLIADTERPERSLHQSVSEQAEELDDLTTQAVIEFSPAQGGGYATEPISIPATHIYVTAEATSTIYVMINGSLAEEIDPASRMPVVISIDPGDEVSFDSQDEIETITVNYYPDEQYIASQTESAQQQTES